jgi:glycerol-3-phosphate dehydrogenase (NAD(P)+)
VVIWGRAADVVREIGDEHRNSRYHPDLVLPDTLRASTDADAALEGAQVVVLAVPSQTLRENLAAWAPTVEPDSVLVSLMKGIELGTALRMSEVIAQVAGVGAERVAVVSGPNLAREIAMRQPAATTVACVDAAHARRLQDACTTAYFRPYWTTDVLGVEIGGSVKNVIALANGMAAGMGFGENSQASLITRGLAEMTRLGVALGAEPTTFLGLAGIGDLIATCSSPLSRNRTFGENLGNGLTVEETLAHTRQTCEGVKSCQSILDLATRHGVDMPITEQVVQVVHHGMPPRQMLSNFMSRETKAETGF